ncbi:tetratricopeptide repeat protein [bacterium]|jgi:tetratricopeptide (TPR) repeat protein|nr:tetratricopeptide repeat protein [bacterium]MBT7310249.1 tetratricopeptide repeat protein [bacterium]
MHNGCTNKEQGNLLAAYEMNMLEFADKLLFETHLKDCKTCCNELFDNAPVANELQAHPGLYGGTLKSKTATQPEKSLFTKIREMFAVKILVPVVVVASLVVMVISLGAGSDVRKLAVVEKMAYVSIDVRSADSELAAEYFASAMNAYQESQYVVAVEELKLSIENADSSWDGWDQAHMYLGVSLMMNNQPDQAIEYLTVVRNSSSLPLIEKGSWLLAQANLQAGNRDQAIEYLADLIINGVVYADKAAEQLHEIEK